MDKTIGLHPDLKEEIGRILNALWVLGFKCIITDGVRTAEQQQLLYAKGRTAPGSIVTHADGIIKKSNHQPKADGFGHAVDCCFIIDGKVSYPSNLMRVYGEMGKALGLVWGGDWKSLVDQPHLELP